MKKFINKSKIINYLSGIIAGILVYMVCLLLILYTSVLNEDYHKSLFKKYDIYNNTHIGLKNSYNGFIKNLKKYSKDNYQKYKEIFDVIGVSITGDIVSYNLDTFREELFDYFKGERNYLPDIHLDINSSNIPIEVQNKLNLEASHNMKNINLSGILLYTNRNDIAQYIYLLRLVYLIVSKSYIVLILMFCVINILILLYDDKSKIVSWYKITIKTAIILNLGTAITILILAKLLIPQIIVPIYMSLPFSKEIIINYFNEMIKDIIALLFNIGLVLLVILVLVNVLKNKKFFEKEYFIKYRGTRYKNVFAIFVFIIIFIIFVVLYLKVNELIYNMNIYGYKSIFEELIGQEKTTTIIKADNKFVYNLRVRIVDDKTKKPVEGVKLFLNGKAKNNEDFFNSKTTDKKGIAQFSVFKGNFRLNFLEETVPDKYKIPSPKFQNIGEPGTTIVTIKLDEKDHELIPKGIVEVEVIDSQGAAIENIETYIDTGIRQTMENFNITKKPNRIYAKTNKQGIAIFKLEPGTYYIDFNKETFPDEDYILPEQLKVDFKENTIIRHVVQLSKK